jgi:hypothetical protein
MLWLAQRNAGAVPMKYRFRLPTCCDCAQSGQGCTIKAARCCIHQTRRGVGASTRLVFRGRDRTRCRADIRVSPRGCGEALLAPPRYARLGDGRDPSGPLCAETRSLLRAVCSAHSGACRGSAVRIRLTNIDSTRTFTMRSTRLTNQRQVLDCEDEHTPTPANLL